MIKNTKENSMLVVQCLEPDLDNAFEWKIGNSGKLFVDDLRLRFHSNSWPDKLCFNSVKTRHWVSYSYIYLFRSHVGWMKRKENVNSWTKQSFFNSRLGGNCCSLLNPLSSDPPGVLRRNIDSPGVRLTEFGWKEIPQEISWMIL